MATKQSEQTRQCTKCPAVLPLGEFPRGRSRGRAYILRYCRECARRMVRERRAKNPQIYRDREAKYRLENQDLIQEQNRRYTGTKNGREVSTRRQRRYRRLAKLRLNANLPVEVVAPFVERMLREWDQRALAELTGVDDRMLRRIVKQQAPQVAQEVADALTTQGSFSLEELYQRAEEWAILTKSRWPIGYHPRENIGRAAKTR